MAAAAHQRGNTGAAVAPADLVLHGGKIVTVDDKTPEAQAIAVRGDTIVAVGSDADITRYIGPSTRVIDLKGALAVPGLIDGHAHFTGVGEAAMNLKLAQAKDWDDIVRMVGEAAKTAKPGEWILGRGWHQEKWSSRPTPNVEGFPVHDAFSKVSPNNPVLLTARERPRRVREREGDADRRRHEDDAGSGRRKDSEGRHRRTDRPLQRAGRGARQPGAQRRSRQAHAGGKRSAGEERSSSWRRARRSRRA